MAPGAYTRFCASEPASYICLNTSFNANSLEEYKMLGTAGADDDFQALLLIQGL